MKTIINPPQNFPKKEVADRIASELGYGESEGWTYTTVPLGDSVFRVEIRDENDEFVAYW